MRHKPLHPPTPPLPHAHRPPHPTGLAASQLLDFVDTARLDQALVALVPEAVDRAFVLRCLVGEGPMHHRGANYILLTLLAGLLPPATLPPEQGAAAGVQVPMRLPPYLADTVEDGAYPLRLPTRALSELAQGNAQQTAAMVDCLTDGPPQHALANVVMVSLIEQLQSVRR